MKKSLLFLVAFFMVSMTVTAQPIQKILGHYTSDSIASEGFSMPNSGTFAIAVMFDADELEMYLGGQVVAIRVGLCESAQISQVFMIPVRTNGKYGDRVYWECDMSQVGWNTVELTTPYDLNLEPGEKLLVGFVYKQVTGIKPLSFVHVGSPYDCYTMKKVGSATKWVEAGFIDRGNLAVQCIVEKDSYPDYLLSASSLQTRPSIEAGEMLPFSMVVTNKGIKQIDQDGLTMKVLVDDHEVATITNEVPFDGGYCTVYDSIPTGNLSSGEHVLTVQVVSVDGVLLEEPISLETNFLVYHMSFPRQKHLIEQLTSTYCQYCPLGSSMLNLLTSMRDDLIWVGIHGNLGSGVDPFRSNQGDSIMAYMTGGVISYPSGAFDRTVGWSDDVNVVGGLSFYEQFHQEVAEYFCDFFDYIAETNPSFAEIDANCTFNEETRMATVAVQGRVSTDFDLMVGEDSRLVVYLVEDSLVAQQVNGSTVVLDYVHNGVFRKALGSIMGEPLNRFGHRYKNVYRFSIPPKWDWTKMRVVAFICRPLSNYVNGFTDLQVNNAQDFRFEISNDVIETFTPDADAAPVQYFDLTGRQLDGPQTGINIVKMSDGSARKVLVK